MTGPTPAERRAALINAITDQHTVSLPHPRRSGPKTVGLCTCGWPVAYGWGGHGQAQEAAEEHITQVAKSRPVSTQRMDGAITVAEGLSL